MSQKVDTTIRFSGLKPGRYIYSYTLTDEFFEEWKNDEIRGGKVEIEAKMERLEHMLMFTFALKGEVTTMCDRCLGDLVIPVEGEEHLCVRFSDTETTDDEDVVVMPESATMAVRVRGSTHTHAAHPPRRRMRPRGDQIHR